MGWIRKTQPEPEHTCEPPVQNTGEYRAGLEIMVPDGGVAGDLWQCDSCGMVWEITSSDRDGYSGALRWRKAAWFTQRRYRKRWEGEALTQAIFGGQSPRRRGVIDPVDDKPFPEGHFSRKPPPGGGGIERPHVILRSASEIDSTPPND